ncbi:MAG: LL-diaminopimelate aminotransferase [Lachnospiraceae bacterium]|jgi:LL-diaminopimelate aminotransferase|uniref:LL-diaminopimelate aminotransferase n=1 Tax=Clostridium sp. (strain SY8519) TaxID=1042156 RepID=UPI0002171CB6|nr:LL-diaminopimelate aminotransferase [Clostridium sp. SY8519]MCI1655872.1 LL-diaminopimelate aminotransferase [Lachnospiraceae bacterium]MCI1658086.1 LL-diaminopimelate aminotransferase [Lachnospiraceae bacterium]MCI2196434.1 LL-diaminopimelate aminotransferase [Lachnospiraceae bacterium]BAK46522.1 PLP-dependent aminotransferase [Clostridium sp. SY8519]
MFKVNENYLKLPGSYLFSTIAKKVAEYQEAHPEKELIRLGIGDVTQPLVPAIIQALHGAVDEMGKAETFRGYAPDLGYDFLRSAIVANDYKARGCEVYEDEVFVSDGAKSDSGNIQELFSEDSRIAVCDPVYPVYVDSNVMAGRTGVYNAETETWSNVIYMPTTRENGFVPEFPKETPDLIYLCLPNNPTGTTLTKDQLQDWVDYANRVGAVIIFDAAYEAYITEENVPHSIYECEGARTCAIEIRSFSKNAGFTGVRLGFTVVPKDLKCGDASLNAMWARRHGTKFNGAPYIVQRAGEAVYTPEGKAQIREQVGYYMKNAATIRKGLADAGFEVYGGINAPYIWMKTPDQMTSWEFFDYLLNEVNIVGTPGSGFGPSGEGYFRLTAFGTYENTLAALERFKAMK